LYGVGVGLVRGKREGICRKNGGRRMVIGSVKVYRGVTVKPNNGVE
jgi:hypothetical protein